MYSRMLTKTGYNDRIRRTLVITGCELPVYDYRLLVATDIASSVISEEKIRVTRDSAVRRNVFIFAGK